MFFDATIIRTEAKRSVDGLLTDNLPCPTKLKNQNDRCQNKIFIIYVYTLLQLECYFIVVKGHSLLSPEERVGGENFEGDHMVFKGKAGRISHRRQSFRGGL